MIVRVLGEGQFEIDEGKLDELNELDDRLMAAIEAGKADAFRDALDALLAALRTQGSKVSDDFLGSSDLVLPGPDSTLEDVRVLLDEEGLIPG